MRSRRNRTQEQSVENNPVQHQAGNEQQNTLGNQGVLAQVNQHSSQNNSENTASEEEQIRRAFEGATTEMIEESLLSLIPVIRVQQIISSGSRGDWGSVVGHIIASGVNFSRVVEILVEGSASAAPGIGTLITSLEIGLELYNMLGDARTKAHASALCPTYGAGVLSTRILGQPVPEQNIRSFTYQRLQQRLDSENINRNTRRILLGREIEADESREDIIEDVREQINIVHSKVDRVWSGISEGNKRLLYRFYSQQGLAALWEETLGRMATGSRAPLAHSEYENHFRTLASH